MNEVATKLVVGAKYRILYKSSMQKLSREAVMVFLGWNAEGHSVWSARPTLGTQLLPRSWVQEVRECDQNIKCYLGRVVRE